MFIELSFRPIKTKHELSYVIFFDNEKFYFTNEDLYFAIKTLQPLHRKIVMFYYGEELSDYQIARIISRPKSTVHYNRQRALAHIRERMNCGVV